MHRRFALLLVLPACASAPDASSVDAGPDAFHKAPIDDPDAAACGLTTGVAACDACANTWCCEEQKDCRADQDCIAAVSCEKGCHDDTACLDACVAKSPKLAAIGICLANDCRLECQ
jgi:hypothetical protein